MRSSIRLDGHDARARAAAKNSQSPNQADKQKGPPEGDPSLTQKSNPALEPKRDPNLPAYPVTTPAIVIR